LKNFKVATYDLQPQMSAFELTEALVPELEKEEVDFVFVQLCNGDMVGHTGIMSAAIQACEAVDQCVEKVITTALAHNYTTLVIADHGNCETMINLMAVQIQRTRQIQFQFSRKTSD
jgi:2,3-bisphosphoglycerate-independent phosphoglycerate mutase